MSIVFDKWMVDSTALYNSDWPALDAEHLANLTVSTPQLELPMVILVSPASCCPRIELKREVKLETTFHPALISSTSTFSMSSQIPPSKRHKHVRSADLMEHYECNPSFLQEMHHDLQNIKTKLEEDHMLVKALDPALKNIDSVLDSLKHIREFKNMPQNQGITISVCFSCFMYLY